MIRSSTDTQHLGRGCSSAVLTSLINCIQPYAGLAIKIFCDAVGSLLLPCLKAAATVIPAQMLTWAFLYQKAVFMTMSEMLFSHPHSFCLNIQYRMACEALLLLGRSAVCTSCLFTCKHPKFSSSASSSAASPGQKAQDCIWLRQSTAGARFL